MRAVDLAVAVKGPNGKWFVELKIGGVQSKLLKESWKHIAHLLQPCCQTWTIKTLQLQKSKKKIITMSLLFGVHQMDSVWFTKNVSNCRIWGPLNLLTVEVQNIRFLVINSRIGHLVALSPRQLCVCIFHFCL